MAKTKDALTIIDRITGDDPKLREMIAEETINGQAGLTQQQLAERVGTKQSVIARLEDADYEGHSLSMLQRIASALHHKLEMYLVPTSGKVHHA
jgi:predicted transcriptional regulator